MNGYDIELYVELAKTETAMNSIRAAVNALSIGCEACGDMRYQGNSLELTIADYDELNKAAMELDKVLTEYRARIGKYYDRLEQRVIKAYKEG